MEFNFTHIGKGKAGECIEITCNADANILIILGKDGWTYPKKKETHKHSEFRWSQDKERVGTKGKHVRLSMNGVCMFSNDEFNELLKAIEKGKEMLYDSSN